MSGDYVSEKKKKKKVHLVGLHLKLTDVHAKKRCRRFTCLHNGCSSHPRGEGGRGGEETCLVQTWPTQHVVCIALKSCYEVAASGGTARECVLTET